MKNKYIHHSHISETKFREIVKCFEHDFTAQETADFTGISRVTVGKLFVEFRKRIVTLEDELPVDGEIELDESYFGPRRVRGKRGRGAGSKIPVFGIIKRGDKVFTKVVNNCSREELLPIIKGQVLEGSDVYTDGWRAYDGLILDGYRHFRIHHHENEFARGKNHVNGIESFWSYTKRRLAKFNGLQESHFLLHLKESQWRWNMRVSGKSIYHVLLETFRKMPI